MLIKGSSDPFFIHVELVLIGFAKCELVFNSLISLNFYVFYVRNQLINWF